MCEPRRGYGAAAWRGLQEWPLDCDRVLFSSVDGSDRLSKSQTSAWQEAIDEGFDMILGDRVSLADGGPNLAPLQRLGNRLCCAAIVALWGDVSRTCPPCVWSDATL